MFLFCKCKEVSELAKHEILLVTKPNYIFSMVHYLCTKPSRLSHLTRHSYGTLRRQTGGFNNWKWPEVCRDSRSNLLTSSPGSPSLPGRPSCPCVPWDRKEGSWVAWNSSFCLTLKNWTSAVSIWQENSAFINYKSPFDNYVGCTFTFCLLVSFKGSCPGNVPAHVVASKGSLLRLSQ